LPILSATPEIRQKTEPPRIHIRYEEGPALTSANGREHEGRYGRIYIEDNGIGFDQKYAEQIFDMFRRLHSNAEYEGTGIVLRFVRRSSRCTTGLFPPWAGRGKEPFLSLPCHWQAHK